MRSVLGDSEMNTDELEARLEGQAETQSLEFKAASPWDVTKLAKDIIALANVQDGGLIIIGVEDGTFVRQGVPPEQSSTFRLEVMKDQMAAYADPHINFSVEFPQDRDGRLYVVIRVLPFEEIPVICKRDSQETQAGTIYYRNRNRRVESARVSNSYDMRDIIEVATVRMMERKRRLGFTISAQPSSPTISERARPTSSIDSNKFDEELDGL